MSNAVFPSHTKCVCGPRIHSLQGSGFSDQRLGLNLFNRILNILMDEAPTT